jgi:hypothetical protein
MKLKTPDIKVETSSDFETQQFGVGDLSLIFEILRSKVYSNPIKIICQEVMSNARDAHREVNKDNVPIEVTTPTFAERFLKIRDFGPGITPKRMADVFIKYAASTKRDTDDQTGGFGLGAKTPFSYTDQFTVISVTPEDGKNVRREYVAYVDESKLGAMSLVKTEETTQPRGTTIMVACKPGDEFKFERAIRQVSKHWDVQPRVLPHDLTWDWQMPEIALSGSDWAVLKKGESQIVIDGIPYPMNIDEIFNEDTAPDISNIIKTDKYDPVQANKEVEADAEKAASHGILLYFDTGDLQVTANREQVEYTPDVIEIIRRRLRGLVIEMRRIARRRLKNASSLHEAVKMWSLWQKFIPLSGIDYRKTNLKNISKKQYLQELADVWRYERDPNTSSGFSKKKMDRYYRRSYYEFDIKDPKVFIIEDDGDTINPSRPRVATAFENEEIIEIMVVRFKNEVVDGKTARERACEDFAWDKLNFPKLSTFKKQSRSNGGTPPIGARIIPIKEFDQHATSKHWTPAEEMDNDDSGVYVVLRRRKAIFKGLEKDTKGTRRLYEALENNGGGPLYGVLERFVPKLGDGWVDLETHLRDKLTELLKTPKLDKWREDSRYYNHNRIGHYLDWPTKVINLFKDKDVAMQLHPDNKINELIEILAEDDKEQSVLRPIVNKIDRLAGRLGEDVKYGTKEKPPFEVLAKAAKKQYPLLAHLSSYNNFDKQDKKDIIAYVNLKDEEFAKAEAEKAQAEAAPVSDVDEVKENENAA